MERGPAKADIHAPCRQRIAELEAKLAAHEKLTQPLIQEIQENKARIRALEHRLHRNSSNSSRPPSSDPPSAPPPAPPEPPSGRKPGGQPGHPPANRKPFPPDEVDHFVPVYPKECHGCHRKIHASSLKNCADDQDLRHEDSHPISNRIFPGIECLRTVLGEEHTTLIMQKNACSKKFRLM